MKLRINKHWRLDTKTYELCIDAQGYRVDLERCYTNAEVMDWIFHTRGKGWGDEEWLGLIDCFELILNPRANLCSFGADKGPCKPRELVDRYVAKRKEQIAACSDA